MIESWKETYHGWMIQVSEAQMGYTFHCWITEQEMGVTDAQNYSTLEQAFSAARLRADLESVRLSLTTFLQGKLQFLLLNSAEQIALENSIAQYIDKAKSR